MSNIKSDYEKVLEQLVAESKVITFTDEESMKIAMELNEGMNDFIRQQRINEVQAEKELKNIHLNF